MTKQKAQGHLSKRREYLNHLRSEYVGMLRTNKKFGFDPFPGDIDLVLEDIKETKESIAKLERICI